MFKRLMKSSFRVMGLHAMVSVVTIFVLPTTAGITFFKDSLFFQWFFTVLFMVGLFMILWVDLMNEAQRDVRLDLSQARQVREGRIAQAGEQMFIRRYGFAVGAISQLPAILAVLVVILSGNQFQALIPSLCDTFLRAWYMMYLQIFEQFPNAVPYIYLLGTLCGILLCGFGYLSGPAQQARMEITIQRNEAKLKQNKP